MARPTEPPPPEFSGEEIAALRKDLKLNQTQLALALGVDTKLIFQWEAGTAFPTLASARKLLALRERRPIETRTRRYNPDPLKGALADPEFWEIHRKLLGHRALYEKVRLLARDYPDPAKPEPRKE